MPSLDVKIRKVEEQDILKVLGFLYNLLDFRVFNKKSREVNLKHYHERLHSAVKRQQGVVGLLFDSPVGYASWEFHPGEVYIPELYVHECFRNLGIGKKLIKETAKIAAIRGDALTLKLPSFPGTKRHEDARSFYEKLGFEYFYPVEYGVAKMALSGKDLVNLACQQSNR